MFKKYYHSCSDTFIHMHISICNCTFNSHTVVSLVTAVDATLYIRVLVLAVKTRPFVTGEPSIAI